MLREAFKVVINHDSGYPHIVKVEITDLDGVSWREAKKQLRNWFLDQAYTLRSLNQKSYFEVHNNVG